MIKHLYIIFGALALGLGWHPAAGAKERAQPSALFLPLNTPSAAYRTAGVYWMPDYYKDNKGRTSTCEGGNCNSDSDYTCESYGYETPGTRDMELYTCDSKYPAGHAGGQCYANCRCQDKYHYQDKTTVPAKDQCLSSEGKMGGGRGCEGKYADCVCQPLQTPGTGEECALYCTFDNSCVKTRCKPRVTPGTGEECKEYCASSNNTICTKKGCKAKVDTSNANDQCVEWCASDRSICTRKICTPSCTSDSSFPYDSYYINDGCGGTCRKAYGDNCHLRTAVNCGSLGCTTYSDCPSKCQTCNQPAPEPEPEPEPEPTPCRECWCDTSYCEPETPSTPETGEKQETCTYTTTASDCSSQCKNVGSLYCSRNGTTYYNGCGSSKCSPSQTCENGTCKDNHTHEFKCPDGYRESCQYGKSDTKAKSCACGKTSGECYKCLPNPCDNYTCPENASCSVANNKPKCTCQSGYMPKPESGVCKCRLEKSYLHCTNDVILKEDVSSYANNTLYGAKIQSQSPCAYCVRPCLKGESGCRWF